MGACCQRLDSIDHVDDLYDLRVIVKTDLDFFMKQHQIITEEKVNFYIFNFFSV
jgi:hypothetical protein